MSERKKYSSEFKLEAVRLASLPGVNKTQVAEELGINANMLRRWCCEHAAAGEKAFGGTGHAKDDEVARLKRELAQVKKERDFLKKAAAFFAKESS